MDACDKWLQQAEALVIEADAKIEGIMHQDTGNLLAEEWVTFVHKYSMQIKDIEQVGLASESKCICQYLRVAGISVCGSCCLAWCCIFLCHQCELEEQCSLTMFLLYPDTKFTLSKLVVC